MAKIITIVKGENNKILRTRSEKIANENIKLPEIQELITDMKATMKEKNGVGLAAPQVGENIRLFIVNTSEGIKIFINPKITYRSPFREIDEEGCLSLPNIWGDVKRSKNITVKFLNEQGEEQTLKAQGLLARIIQHENDHIDGILFIDKVKNIKTSI